MAEKKPARRSATQKRGRAWEAPADPAARLRELHEEMFRLRFQFATRQLTNTSRFRQVRREIARVMTYQHQQVLAAQPSGSAL